MRKIPQLILFTAVTSMLAAAAQAATGGSPATQAGIERLKRLSRRESQRQPGDRHGAICAPGPGIHGPARHGVGPGRQESASDESRRRLVRRSARIGFRSCARQCGPGAAQGGNGCPGLDAPDLCPKVQWTAGVRRDPQGPLRRQRAADRDERRDHSRHRRLRDPISQRAGGRGDGRQPPQAQKGMSASQSRLLVYREGLARGVPGGITWPGKWWSPTSAYANSSMSTPTPARSSTRSPACPTRSIVAPTTARTYRRAAQLPRHPVLGGRRCVSDRERRGRQHDPGLEGDLRPAS